LPFRYPRSVEHVDPTRPSLALDQLQLALEGVPPLSAEERLERWLADQPEETAQVHAAFLYLRDANTRSARAQRWADLRAVQAPYDRAWGWLVPGGTEVVWLYDEAGLAYVDGLFLATLLCAHAACERVLAGCLQMYPEQPDKNWLRWGLGPLAKTAFERDLIDSALRDDLAQVTEVRKVSAHFKPPLTPNTVMLRASERAETSTAQSDDELLDEVLQDDAMFALKVATKLIRGNQGLSRVRLY
jgi:hypothetical protein